MKLKFSRLLRGGVRFIFGVRNVIRVPRYLDPRFEEDLEGKDGKRGCYGRRICMGV